MTDNYGNDPHDPHGDPMHDEHGHEHGHDDHIGAEGSGGENEIWHDEHPPVDDFADQPAEEMATVSEETEMPEEHDEPEVMRRKTSVLLPVAAGIGGLLFLGALLYWQFGGMFRQQAAAPIPPLRAQAISPLQNAATPVVTPSSSPAAASAPVAPTTSLAPITDATTSTAAPAIAGLQGGTATPDAGPAPVTTPVVTTPVVASPAATTPFVASPDTTASAAVAPKTASTVMAKTPVMAAAPVAPATAVTPAASASTPKDSAVDARLNALAASVESMQKSLASATQQLNQVSNMIAANPPNAGLEDRLSRIEQQLSQRQTAPAASAASVSESPAMLSDGLSPVVTPSHHHHTHKSKTSNVIVIPPDSESVTTATHHSSRHHATAAVAAKSKAPRWILRAATPTEAWVSTDPFSSDLRHVQIGDTLPGIGTITDIRQRGESWMVVGSKGTLK